MNYLVEQCEARKTRTNSTFFSISGNDGTSRLNFFNLGRSHTLDPKNTLWQSRHPFPHQKRLRVIQVIGKTPPSNHVPTSRLPILNTRSVTLKVKATSMARPFTNLSRTPSSSSPKNYQFSDPWLALFKSEELPDSRLLSDPPCRYRCTSSLGQWSFHPRCRNSAIVHGLYDHPFGIHQL